MSFIDIVLPDGFECGFQSNLNFNDSKYCFKYEYGDNGKRCMIIGDDKNVFLEWFRKLPEAHRKMYELIRSEDVVAEFYDIDFAIQASMSIDEVDDLSTQIIDVLLNARNSVADQTISKRDIIVLSAHTPVKLSLHVISKRTYFKNNNLQRIFALDVYESLLDEDACFNIDSSVYSNNRCFRMFLNHKHGKDNNLVLFNPAVYNYASFEDTWVVLTHKDLSGRVEIKKYLEEDIDIVDYHDRDEKLTEDLESHLQGFLEKYPYFVVEINPSKRVNRINRTDNVTRPCLTDPSDSHSKENMFWYISSNAIYVGCFCKKGKPICLGMRDGIHKIDIQPEPFKYATHTSNDFKTYKDFQRVVTLFDTRRTGKGKTTCAMAFAAHFKRVLLIHHRQTLDDDYIQKYPEFTSYKKGLNSSKQTVCFNSLSKIDITQYDLIIIDEMRSLLKQSEMKDMVYSTHTLFSILEDKSIPLVMLDANMTDADIEFVSKYRTDSNRIVIHDTDVCTQKSIFIMTDDATTNKYYITELLSRIDKDIRKNQKVVIVYNRSIEYMNALLSTYTGEYRVLHVNKNTRESVNMDTDTWYDDYDIIAYSPTISEGVSINDKRFKTVNGYGLFTTTSCPAESVSQMLARFRAIMVFIIQLDISRKKSIPVFSSKKDVLAYVNNNIRKLKSIISQSHFNVRRQGSSMFIIEDEFFDLFSKNLYEQSIDYHNYKRTLIQKLVNNGYSVFEDFTQNLSEVECEEIDNHISEMKDIETRRIITGILNASNICYDEYNALRDNGTSCEQDDFKVQKYLITSSVNMIPEFLKEDTVRTFRNVLTRSILRSIRNCFGFIKIDNVMHRIPVDTLIHELANTTVKGYELTTNFLDQKKSVTQFIATKLDWINTHVKQLGFRYVLSPEGIDASVFWANMTAILKHYTDSRNFVDYRDTELLFGVHYSRDKQRQLKPAFITDKVMNLLGVKFNLNKSANIVYQQIQLNIKLCDGTRQEPNLLSGIILPPDIIAQYDNMFMRGELGNYCEVCDRILSNGGVSFRHLNSKGHIKNLEKKK